MPISVLITHIPIPAGNPLPTAPVPFRLSTPNSTLADSSAVLPCCVVGHCKRHHHQCRPHVPISSAKKRGASDGLVSRPAIGWMGGLWGGYLTSRPGRDIRTMSTRTNSNAPRQPARALHPAPRTHAHHHAKGYRTYPANTSETSSSNEQDVDVFGRQSRASASGHCGVSLSDSGNRSTASLSKYIGTKAQSTERFAYTRHLSIQLRGPPSSSSLRCATPAIASSQTRTASTRTSASRRGTGLI